MKHFLPLTRRAASGSGATVCTQTVRLDGRSWFGLPNHGTLRGKRVLPLTALAALLLFAPTALAHAFLDHADPKVGSAVNQSPATVEVWFTEDFDTSGSGLEVQDANGNQVDKQDCHVDPKDKAALIVSLKNLPPGKYKVIWHALCLQGHKTHGDFKFEVKGS
jgi:copper resistance protein C